MSKLNIDQKTVMELFTEKKADFLIPDYQRPYAWGEKECQTLWYDLYDFAFPDNDCDKFNSDEEYFLGPIVMFKNDDGKLEIIDGQQRLTTLMLLLRAFYQRYGSMNTKRAEKTAKFIEWCIWKTDEYGDADKDALKINSEVATDDEKGEFLSILIKGDANGMKSHYAQNYQFFQRKINEFTSSCPDYFSCLPIRIMKNCILLPIEAESQDTALRIFSTLNDRGKPLSDADIFKAQFYKYYGNLGKKDEFIKKWKDLEKTCNDIFHPVSGTPMDEAFTRYMYFERAKKGIKDSTTEALRKFYEKNSYELLKNDEILENIIDLTNFWKDVVNQNSDRFSEKILRRLYVLNFAPNGMWTYFVSVYYLSNRVDGKLDEDAFYQFLSRITAFIWTFAVLRPGVNNLRSPVYTEMLKIVNHQEVDFKENRFEPTGVMKAFNDHEFSNSRAITRSMLTWWAFQDDKQKLLSFESVLEIEHIFARNRQEKEKSLMEVKNLESLGNKALLEKRINISASDYHFADKVKYYQGFTNSKGQVKGGTKVKELLDIAASKSDFVEADIEARHDAILEGFIQYLGENGLLK